MPTVVSTSPDQGTFIMIIGIDPHKASHTATAVDPTTNTPVASLRIDASITGYRQLLRWALQFPRRRWAVENARGLGCHLTQWLIARDEHVVDVATTATARVRELSRGGCRKNDVIDASAAASVAALHGDAVVAAADDLSVDEQEILLEIIRRRIAKRNRDALVRDVADARAEFRSGKTGAASVSGLMDEVRGES